MKVTRKYFGISYKTVIDSKPVRIRSDKIAEFWH